MVDPSVVAAVLAIKAILAQPAMGGAGRFVCLTEQGEVITAKMPNPGRGRRNLEVVGGSDHGSGLLAHTGASSHVQNSLKAMEELSNHTFRAYRHMVYETEGFEQYFWESTVISEIAGLNIGSRPCIT